MDLIYTNANRVDLGVLSSHTLDLSIGAEENDFELILGSDEPILDHGAYLYMEGTEYGGIVDGMRTRSDIETITYNGRTWHGIINSKVIEPDAGENYLIVSGEANEILAMMIARLGLSGLFVVAEKVSDITIKKYQFHRYCKGYDGLRDMLGSNGAKLKIAWENRSVVLSAEPIVDYTDSPIDGDMAVLSVEQQKQKVNHLVCLGQGNLAEREVIHLYVDQFGRIGDVQYYTGLDEISDIYENTNAESSEELRNGGITRMKTLRNNDKAEISVPETALVYDIGDVVGASEMRSGISVAAAVSQKIVKINNGAISIEYKTGG